MTAGVPWSVNAVEPDTWATAREAARRAGLSVGEWLEQTIRQGAGEAMMQPRPPEPRREPSERRTHPERDPRVHTERGEFRMEPAVAASLVALNGRVEGLMRELRSVERSVPSDIGAAIDRLDARLDTLLKDAPTARANSTADLEQKLNQLGRAVDQLSQTVQRGGPAPIASSPSMAELDQAIAEITTRQSTLGGPSFQRAPASSDPYTSTSAPPDPIPPPDLSGLERQIRALTEEMQALRRSSAQGHAVDELRNQLSELGGALADLAPRRSIETLERAIGALATRVDQAARTEPQQNYLEVANALADIRAALADVRPAESFTAVETDLHSLSQKLDALTARGLDGPTLGRLQAEIGEVRSLLSSALPTEVLRALVDQIELLVRKFQSQPTTVIPDHTVLQAIAGLERRIDDLGNRLEQAARVPAAAAINDIAGRLSDLQRAVESFPRGEPSSIQPLIQNLADKLEAAEARLGSLGAIERGLNDLFAQFEDTRSGILDLAQRAARSAVRDFARETPQPQPQPQLQSQPQPPTAFEQPVTEFKSVPTPEIKPAPFGRESQPTAPAASLAPKTADADPITITEVELPADYPLEPGSGGPQGWRPGLEAEDPSTSGTGPNESSESRPNEATSRTADFIAAARRAAQEAAAEKAKETPRSRAMGAVRDFGTSMARSKRSILIGLFALVVIVFGTIRFADVLLPGIFSSDEPPAPLVIPSLPPPAEETPAPATPPSSDESPDRSSLPGSDPSLASAPPAGIIGPATTTAFLGRLAETREVTGSSTSRANKPGAIAFLPQDLPAGIGSPALRTAALSGDASAAYEIGARYYDGRGVDANVTEAVRWFELARSAGSAPAAYRLGTMYEKGHGVPKNLEEARRYYVVAAEVGHTKAMHNLAVLYAEGIEGKPDYRAAARWFRMAGERGLSDSQYNLGILYARGVGVDQNLAESYRWFALAAEQGDGDAIKKRDDIAGRLDGQTLSAARLAAQTWTPIPVDPAVSAVRTKPEWEKVDAVAGRKRVKN